VKKLPPRPIVIFDMDGLMIDSELLQSISFKQMLKNHGVTVRKKIVQILGVRVVENIETMKKKYGIKENTETLFKEKNKIYSKLLEKKVVPMPGVFTLIQKLEKSGVRLALASSSNYNHICLVLKKLNLEGCFEIILSGERLKKGKPDPEIYQKTAKKLKAKPQQCLVLEDTQTGVTAAKKAGMKCIAVPNQYTKSQDFFQADLIVESLKSISPQLIFKVIGQD